MNINMYESGGNLSGGFSIPGMTLLGPLLLSGRVNSSFEAVHRQYVDTALTNINAANFISGTIPVGRLPAFTGDIESTAGSNVLTLAKSTVVPGDYTKVVVNEKGIVTSGLSLTEADIPNFSFTKITNNKPNTLEGYGINNGVSTVNGVISGNLKLANNPVDPTEAATKQYADNNVLTGGKIVTGDVINSCTSVTPNNFLRCNGGQISKTAYSALYAVIGDTFSDDDNPGNGRPWEQQYGINNASNVSLNNWKNDNPIPTSLTRPMVIVTKNRVYLFDSTNIIAYTSVINSDGTLGGWTVASVYPSFSILGSAFLVVKNKVYLIGGLQNGQNSNGVYTATINQDGTLNSWTQTVSLPVATFQTKAVVVKNKIVVLNVDITNSVSSTSIYTASINSDGSISSWVSEINLPSVKSTSGVAVIKNKIYLIGGNDSNPKLNRTNTVFSITVNSNGSLGAVINEAPIPYVLLAPTTIVTKNRVYLLGGGSSLDYIDKIISAKINQDGSLGVWENSGNLLYAGGHRASFIVKNRIYLVGGSIPGSGSSNYVQYTDFNGGANDYSAYYDGSITPTDPNNFSVPNYTSYENNNMFYYIKY